MKRLFLLCILLLLVTSVAAAEPYLKSWVYPGDTFTSRDRLFSVTQGDSPYSILLQQGENEFVISYNECAISVDGLEKFCFVTSDYIDCQRGDYTCKAVDGQPDDWCCPYDVNHVRFDAGHAVWAAYLEFWDITPIITVNRQAEPSVIKLNEHSTVTLTFENTGDQAITNAHYVETIPEGFSIKNHPAMEKSGNKLLLSFTLNPGAKKTYKYTVEPSEYVSGDPFTGNLTYMFEESPQEVIPKQFTIAVPIPFTITHKLSASKTEVDEDVTYTYTLKNNDGKSPMDLALQFTIPGLVKTKPDVDDDLSWEGTLEKEETKEFAFTLHPTKTGRYGVTSEATMHVNDEEFSSKVQDTLAVELAALAPEIRVSKEPLKGGQQFVLRLLLHNTNEETPFYDISGHLSGGSIDNRLVTRHSIAPGEYPVLLETNLSAPDEDGTLTFTWEGTYKTRAGERFNFSTTKSVKVIPLASTYEITQKLNSTDVHPGDTITVVVSVKNRQGEYRTVSVTDTFPGGAVVKNGVREKEMSLKKDETREAYTYEVTIPESYQGAVFTITTQVFDHQDGESYTMSKDVSIALPQANETIAENISSSKGEPVIEHPPVEKKGFFRKIIDGIIGFFENLFS